MTRALILALAVTALTLPAATRAENLPVKTINFDLWCQETQHLPPDRCDKRTPKDDADFEAYRAKVEKYEVDDLHGNIAGAQLNRAILHNDPVDNPVTQDPAAARQSPATPTAHPNP